MRSRMLPALVAGALTITMLAQGSASADPREVTGPSLPATASSTAAERAGDALARAQALFAEKAPAAARRQLTTSGREASMVLNDLRQLRGELSPRDRRTADALLARPTQGTEPTFPGEWQYTVPEETPVCGDDICVHYVATTQDAPPMADGDDPGTVPDAVDRALATTEQVHQRYLAAGYLSPDRDGTLGGDTDKIDIYMNNIGDDGLYGYCTSDQPGKGDGTSNYWAYCVIDDDFSKAEFPTNTPRENQQVTIAHEFFHAVQYAYDANEAGWFLEATATWAEDEQFDSVNDNWNYLPFGQMGSPATPLNTYSGLVHYGNWIFFRFMTEKYRSRTGSMPNLVLEMIERGSNRTGEPNASAMQALQEELKQRGTTLSKVYTQFAVANRIPAKSYDEGRNYKVAKPVLVTFKASRRAARLGGKLRHLTNAPVRFKAGQSLGSGAWKLRMSVNMQPKVTVPSAKVFVFKRSGQVAVSTIRLNRKTNGSKTVSFRRGAVKYVELVLINASPTSNKGKTIVNARVFR